MDQSYKNEYKIIFSNLFVIIKNKMNSNSIKFHSFLFLRRIWCEFSVQRILGLYEFHWIYTNSARKYLVFSNNRSVYKTHTAFETLKLAPFTFFRITECFGAIFLKLLRLKIHRSSLCRHVKPYDCIWNVKTRAILRMDYLDGMRRIFPAFVVAFQTLLLLNLLFFKCCSQMTPVA